jgi:intein/homing endonuclease
MHGNRKYTVNESFFEQIDTEEKAYVLGFIMADGYNNVKKRYINIRLAVTDEPHLIKIAKCLESNKPIRRVISSAYKSDTYESCQFSIDSVVLSKQLERLGVDGNKSRNLDFPLHLNPSLYSHFIRGYFDGDGSVSWTQKLKKAYISICGTEQFCSGIKTYLFQTFDIGGSIVQNKQKPNSCKELHICGNQQILFLLTWMYGCGKVALERKKKKSLDIIKNIQSLRKHRTQTLKKYELELVKG